MTKAELYEDVERVVVNYHLDPTGFPRDTVALAEANGFGVEYREFKTRGLRGVALPQKKAIILKKWLSRSRRNFYAGHELVHHLKHAGLHPMFNCFDGSPNEIDDYLEWQANEGAAEFLLPHRTLLRLIELNVKSIKTIEDFYAFKKFLAWHFNIPDATVFYRIERLRYATYQYLGGRPMGQIEILSEAEQARRGINVPSLNDKFPFPSRDWGPNSDEWRSKRFRVV